MERIKELRGDTGIRLGVVTFKARLKRCAGMR